MADSAAAKPITLATLLDAHRLLMTSDYYATEPGQLRTVQNWIAAVTSAPYDAGD